MPARISTPDLPDAFLARPLDHYDVNEAGGGGRMAIAGARPALKASDSGFALLCRR
jgi:hypothetical protein